MNVRICAFTAGILALVGCGEDTQTPIALTITTDALPAVAFRADYSTTVTASGGSPPYKFSLASGAFPEGITIATGGLISGIAGEPGTKELVIKVEDSAAATATAMFSLRVRPDPLEIVTRSLPSGREGTTYEHDLSGKGGVKPWAWSISEGALPDGIVLAANGTFSGAPTTAGSFSFTVRLADTDHAMATQALQIVVSAANPMIVTSTIPKGRTDSTYEARLVAEGGDAPYAWELISGALPSGLTLGREGLIAGTPTETGDFSFVVRVIDGRQRTDMGTVTMRVIAPLVINTAGIQQIIRRRAYAFDMRASGGEPPYVWSATWGANGAPNGIVFAPTGHISGTTEEIGEYPVTVRARDGDGVVRSALYSIKVDDRFIYTVTPTGSDASFPTTCTGTTVSYKWVDFAITDSFQVADVDITVDLTFDTSSDGTVHMTLYGPDWSPSVLCGDDRFTQCDASQLNSTFDDDGGLALRPEHPLAVFDGLNPQGTWKLLIATADPSCSNLGTINSVSLTMTDNLSPASYVRLWGWPKNNLVTEPYVHITHPALPEAGGIGPHGLSLQAAIFDVGPNGYPEGGGGDDVRDPTPMIWSWQGAPLQMVDLAPDGTVTVDNTIMVCNPGCGTGQSQISASGGGYVATTMLRVLPPDFNPQKRRY